MCTTCGCGEDAETRITTLDLGGHAHQHDEHGHIHHDLGHGHDEGRSQAPGHDGDDGRTIYLEQQILGKNGQLAAHNRGWFEGRAILAVNLMSSPGSGKTTLLERTIRQIGDELSISVIEGDQETPLDAERIHAVGRPVVQINTGSGCHLDAAMVGRAVRALDPVFGSTVFIENVGNLVCPAMFDLGEAERVVVASVTEGADKPLKYPQMFSDATLILVNKVDLAPYVDFDEEVFTRAVRAVNQKAEIRTVSAKTGDGCDGWYAWIRERRPSTGCIR